MSKRILLVSTEPKYFEAPGHAFQTRGCEIFGATSGTDAIAFLTAHGADLVLCHGAPEGVSASALTSALGPDGEIVVVADPEDNTPIVATYRGLSSVHMIDEPVKKGQLLQLTGKLLGSLGRKFISILVQVKVSKPKPTTVFGKSKDLSETGVLVECSQPLQLYDKVGISFLIPGADKMIQGEALVARDDGGEGRARRYGLKFLEPTEEDRTTIRAYLQGKLGGKAPGSA